MDTIGHRLRKARESVGKSQRVLAKDSGVSRATIAKLELGEHTSATTSTLQALAEALGCSLHDLVPTEIDPVLSDFLNSEEGRKLLPEQRQWLLDNPIDRSSRKPTAKAYELMVRVVWDYLDSTGERR